MKQVRAYYCALSVLFISTLHSSEFFKPTDEYNQQDQAQDDEKFSKFCIVDPQKYYGLKKKNEILAEFNKQAIEQNEELFKEIDFYKRKTAETHKTLVELKKCVQEKQTLYEEIGKTRAQNISQGKILSLEDEINSLQSAHQTMLNLMEKLTVDNHIYEKKNKTLRDLVIKSDTEVKDAIEESRQTLEHLDYQIKRKNAEIDLVKEQVFASTEESIHDAFTKLEKTGN